MGYLISSEAGCNLAHFCAVLAPFLCVLRHFWLILAHFGSFLPHFVRLGMCHRLLLTALSVLGQEIPFFSSAPTMSSIATSAAADFKGENYSNGNRRQ
jgi:hypothetical protein